MIRLTFREKEKFGVVGMNEANQDKKLYSCVLKLIDYEDTGLSPNDILKLKEENDSYNETMKYLNKLRDENNQLKQQFAEKDKEIERYKQELEQTNAGYDFIYEQSGETINELKQLAIQELEKELKEKKFSFDYGVVTYEHRFSIDRSLDDYVKTTLNKCIRMGIVYKYKTIACDKLVAEMQVLYKDENNKAQCLCLDLHDWTFEIKYKGDMQVQL